jgi:hypothetical protein
MGVFWIVHICNNCGILCHVLDIFCVTICCLCCSALTNRKCNSNATVKNLKWKY